MNTSEQGIKLLHHFEGCKLKAYKCPAGVWTIGFGNTTYEDGSKVKEGDTITQERANELFKRIIKRFEQRVLEKIKRPLKQHEFDALVSFCYNAGTSYKNKAGQWVDYNIWKKAEAQDKDIREYWETLAVTGGGKKLPGLVRRRAAEVQLYIAGVFVA